MRVFPFSVVLAAVAVAAVGCASPAATTGTSGPGPQPAAAVAAESGPARPAATVDGPESTAGPGQPKLVMSVDGVGPYKIGARVEQLRKAGLLGELTTLDEKRCRELYRADASGTYSGTFQLVIRHQVLVEIGTAGGDLDLRTREGAGIGMSWPEIRKLYGQRGAMVKDSTGKRGFLVKDGDRVMLFSGHPVRPGIGYVAIGMADHTEHVFRTGEPC